MRKITQEEISQLPLKIKGARVNISQHPVVVEARKLGVGDAILVEKSEWDKKSGIAQVASTKEMKFSTRTFTDESAWVLTRVK